MAFPTPRRFYQHKAYPVNAETSIHNQPLLDPPTWIGIPGDAEGNPHTRLGHRLYFGSQCGCRGAYSPRQRSVFASCRERVPSTLHPVRRRRGQQVWAALTSSRKHSHNTVAAPMRWHTVRTSLINHRFVASACTRACKTQTFPRKALINGRTKETRIVGWSWSFFHTSKLAVGQAAGGGGGRGGGSPIGGRGKPSGRAAGWRCGGNRGDGEPEEEPGTGTRASRSNSRGKTGTDTSLL